MYNNGITRKIVLWGLPGSGKTTFLLAFLKAMRLFGADMGWNYTLQTPKNQANDLFQKNTLPDFIETHKLPGLTKHITNIPIDLYFQNARGNIVFDHSCEIVDAPGESILEDERYLKHLSDTDALICILDRPQSNQNYLKALPILQDYLRAPNGKSQLRVAFCLAKADEHMHFSTYSILAKEAPSDQQGSFRKSIASVIGQDVLVSMEQLMTGAQSRYFVTSSVGWTQAKHGGFFPNCVSVSGESSLHIYKPALWEPNGVLEVILWLLDELDLRLQDPEMETLRYEQMTRLYWKWYKETKRIESFHNWVAGH